MRHEFSIYEHLTSRGVEQGIPLVFGLFKDVETDAMALVMSHVGKSLWELRTDPSTIQVKVSASVKDAYLRIMSNIHDAGVRHCDLRPENLMLADDDTVTIIDFDQATINPSTEAKKREIHLLGDLLEGGILYDSKR
ncbi:Negative regulator of sexual conjugation and meiosis [Termitomyces sp. T112]|nr:Negative regulator of sexual conjugation and meiosis [Termitomyces sp. T112]